MRVIRDYIPTFSLIKGFWFVFNDGENTIVAGGSSVSGKELVYVNGKLFSEKRSLKTKSEHEFDYGEAKYKIVFDVINIATAKMKCSLFVNGELSKAYRVALKFSFVKLFLCLVLGITFGIIGVCLGWPLRVIALLSLLILLMFLLLFKPSKDFVFEETAT